MNFIGVSNLITNPLFFRIFDTTHELLLCKYQQDAICNKFKTYKAEKKLHNYICTLKSFQLCDLDILTRCIMEKIPFNH